jgi:Mn-dependent DtxR family transcriptional regulator
MAHLNESLLLALFDCARADERASVQSVALRLGLSRREVAVGLNQLDQLGLVRAATIRLTFLGLAKAAGLVSRQRTTVAA